MYMYLLIWVIYPVSIPSVGKTDWEMCNGNFIYVLLFTKYHNDG
jgi:hypothetical protein